MFSLKIKSLICVGMLLTVIAITFSSVCFAEVKSVIKDYTYQIGSGESRIDAEKNALIEVKLLAIEDVGTYLESDIEIVNSHLEKEEIWALAAGIMQTTVLETNSISEDDTCKIYIKINAIVDTKDLKKKLNNRNFIDETKKLQESNKMLLQGLKDLNAKLICVQNEPDKKKIQTEIAQTQSQLRANDWFEEGCRALRGKKYDIAIAAYTNAIALNSKYAAAYHYRGGAYCDKGQMDEAISDNSEAIRLNPQYADAYNTRGVAYCNKGQMDAGMSDFNEAIRLNPKEATAYFNRGFTYDKKGQIDAGISDYSEAIRLNPQYVYAYLNRGAAYYAKGQFDEAISDYSEAIRLNPQYFKAYHNRGLTYQRKGQIDAAISDYDKAICLNPQDADAYYKRGDALADIGRTSEAIESFKMFLKCATLGDPWIEKGKRRIRDLGGQI